MLKKIALMSLVLFVGNSVYGAASGGGWIRVKSRAEKNQERQAKRAQRQAEAARAEEIAEKRRKQQQQEERKKREQQALIRRKNELTHCLFVVVNKYISITWFAEDCVDRRPFFTEMERLVELGANVNAVNSGSKETVLYQAIRCSRLCLVEFLLRNGATITQEEAGRLRMCVEKDRQSNWRKLAYDADFLLSFSKGLDSDEPSASSASSSSSVGSHARNRYCVGGVWYKEGPDGDYYPSDPID